MPDQDPNNQPASAGQQLGGSYALFDQLGVGGMGVVYRGRNRSGEIVAIKLLRPDLAADAGIVARFLQERSILIGLSHPNVVRVHDLVAEGGSLAIVMDLVEGQDLRAELTRRGTLPAAEAASLMSGVLRGLSAVHACGIVHRDLKPENVMLDRQSKPGSVVPRLTDFGVAKLVEGASTRRQTSVIGTPSYMAPELADDRDPSVASDLYGVGIMLYEILCGVTPFAGGSPLAVLRKHAEQAPGRPEGVPDELWSLVAALLAKRPGERPASAAVVADRLEALLPELAATVALPTLTAPPPADPDGETMLSTLVAEPEPAWAGPVSHSRWTLVIALVAALLLIGGGVAAAVALNGRGGASPKDQAVKVQPTASAITSPSITPTDTTTGTPTGTPTSTDSAAATAPAGELPNFVGGSLSAAVDMLSAAGTRYVVNEISSDTKKDNTVVGQSPAAGRPPGELVTLTVSRVLQVTYLDELGPLVSSWDGGPVAVRGKTYSHGLSSGLDCYQAKVWEYDLGIGYRTFTGLAGLTDTSSSSASARVEVYADDRRILSKDVALGKPASFSLDMTGVLRLKVTVTVLQCDSSVDSAFALGDARLLGLPSATAAPTP